jgi:hypothetical protein
VITAKSQNNAKLPGTTVLLAGLGAVTLYFSTTLEDPFNVPKLILLIFITSWLSGHLISSYKKYGFDSKLHEKKILFVLSLFLCFMLVSTLNAGMWVVAFFGDIQRRNGFLTYLALVTVFLFTLRVTNLSLIFRFYKTAILIGFVMSVYGVVQISGKDFVAWNNPNNSMISTLGNPNFASAMLAVISMLCIAIYSLDLPILFKLLATIIIPVSLYAIVKSNSLQGLVVIAVSFGFYLTFAVYRKFSKAKFRLFFFIPYLFFACIAVAGMLQRGPLESILYKDSVSVRGFYWRAAIEMLKNNLWLGVGSDRYGAYFREFREVEYAARYGFDITSSNAHNVILQFFATNGLIVGSFYVLFLAMVLRSGIRKSVNYPYIHGRAVLGLLSAWVGFQAQAFISIDQIGVSIWGWILSGLILGFSYEGKETKKNPINNQSTINKHRQVEFNFLQTSISCFVLIPAIYISSLLYSSDRDSWLARSEFASPDSSTMVKLVDKVLQNPLTVPTNKVKAASYLIEKGFVAQGVLELEKIYKADKRDVDSLRVIAIGQKLSSNLELEVGTRLLISSLDPFDASNYLRLCELYIFKKEFVQARLMKEKILAIAPNSEIAERVVLLVGEN